MPLVFASRLIQLAKLMMKPMGNALLAILDMSYPRSENVSRQNKSIKILIVRLSEMACVLNVQRELSLMLLVSVSLSILLVKLSMKLMENAPHVIQDLSYQL